MRSKRLIPQIAEVLCTIAMACAVIRQTSLANASNLPLCNATTKAYQKLNLFRAVLRIISLSGFNFNPLYNQKHSQSDTIAPKSVKSINQ
ncbi:hypothetical protein T4D_8867 [Trichinella pseudospiralis]|uniref:Secreted protein n=2 Tax=Trichinella pseudospiralis TaxID=6337 RepID=A0A0V1FDX3_TRIPS|nr:hypothetical protein T4D_8867 [Trichinella pseudospiralis]